VFTGGVFTGGVFTGGVFTGGVFTGGVFTGGVFTGGVFTGGVCTCVVETEGVGAPGSPTARLAAASVPSPVTASAATVKANRRIDHVGEPSSRKMARLNPYMWLLSSGPTRRRTSRHLRNGRCPARIAKPQFIHRRIFSAAAACAPFLAKPNAARGVQPLGFRFGGASARTERSEPRELDSWLRGSADRNRSPIVRVPTPRGRARGDAPGDAWAAQRERLADVLVARRAGKQDWAQADTAHEAIRKASLLPPKKRAAWLDHAAADARKQLENAYLAGSGEPIPAKDAKG
jgi:hypothetical protein